MLELQNISLTLGQKVLFNHASARIGNQYRVGLIGRNGTGKSTLIKILTGIHPADHGEVILDGKPARILNAQEAQALGIGAFQVKPAFFAKCLCS